MNSARSISTSSIQKGEAACPVDGIPGYILGYSKQETVYQCPSCELCYLGQSVRSNASLDNQWYVDFEKHLEWGTAFLKEMRKSYLKQLEVLAELVDGRQLADFGCGV